MAVADSEHDHLAAQLAALAPRLARETRGDLLLDRASRGRYATDASIYQIMPLGVFLPATEEDVDIALACAHETGIPVLARGAGTSQCGQTVGRALVIDTSRHLRSIVAIDARARTAQVQAGVVLDQLNEALRPHGLWFPVDVSTSAQCTLGGMAGNNSCGSRSIAYGNMVHNVLALDVWLADSSRHRFGGPGHADADADADVARLAEGVRRIAQREDDEIAARFPKQLRRVGGYNLDLYHPQSPRPYTADGSANLAHLLVGSEGTLALTRQLLLPLVRLPARRVLGVVNFARFGAAMAAAQHIVPLAPTAVELVDRTMIELARANPEFAPVIERVLVGRPDAILLVEFAGEEDGMLERKLDDLSAALSDHGHDAPVVRLVTAAEQKALWEVRKAGLNIMMSARGDGKPVSFIEDCAVPLEHLEEYTAALTEVFTRHGTRGTWYAHASVGTLHVRPILDMRRDGGQKMRAIATEAAELVQRFKGAFSGEHGDGLVRTEWVAWQFGPRLVGAFRDVKALFDPHGILNPGKIVGTPRMDDASTFRFPPGYRVIPVRPALDWSAWDVAADVLADTLGPPGSGGDPAHGLAKAVDMCNNNGHCRKFDAGSMCPSFRATRNEIDLTRGRANTLRLALSGQLGPLGLADPEVGRALDLCVSCKGCKRECPTGVDMARMKIEALHAARRTRGLTLRERLIAHLPRYRPWAQRIAPLLNLVNEIEPLRRLFYPMAGFTPDRRLPRWRRPLPRRPRQIPAREDVILWTDTFSAGFDTENVLAAERLLQQCGYRVQRSDALPGAPLCCGRTALAVGLVTEARLEARRVLERLDPWLEAGAMVVGLEPSCLLTLRDEYLVLGLGSAGARLASRAVLLEEFLAAERAAGRLRPTWSAIGVDQVWLHGHCHQKALGAFAATQEVLSWIPGLRVSTLPIACCGQAGSFGYEAEHAEASRRIAAVDLLPQLDALPADAVVLADGTSCRHQMEDLAGRRAVHVVQVLLAALEGRPLSIQDRHSASLRQSQRAKSQ